MNADVADPHPDGEHFKPVGTMFILAMFVLTILVLWGSVYLILISRGLNT